jgi:hypothetical protein
MVAPEYPILHTYNCGPWSDPVRKTIEEILQDGSKVVSADDASDGEDNKTN